MANNPVHWRAHARESRQLAEQLHDPKARRMMLKVAESYDQLAKDARARLAAKPEPSLVPERS